MIVLLQLLLVLVTAPLLLGVITKTKARVAGRSGPPLLQAYYDIAKLLRKGTVLSSTTTWVFLLGPAVAVVVPVLCSLLLPLAGPRAPIAFTGDLILFVYLFALSRFCTTTAALDTGSAFEGMGAARELTFAALAEPALFFGLLALARISGSLSLSSLLAVGEDGWHRASAALVLIVASWFIVLLAENSRVPFDDPNTHLELTMIHEVMVLDHSGPAFGLILYGSALKLFVFSALVADVLLPRTGIPLADAAATLGAVLGVGVAIGLVESGMARLRLVRIPQLLIAASLVAGFAVVLVLR
ncbi:MAG: respiratory chain complex I subunit 1 family protein [Thermoanaerobaculia bacterium]